MHHPRAGATKAAELTLQSEQLEATLAKDTETVLVFKEGVGPPTPPAGVPPRASACACISAGTRAFVYKYSHENVILLLVCCGVRAPMTMSNGNAITVMSGLN